MERIIKLIWDFNGEDAVHFAEHHQKHLAEFANKENLLLKDTGVEKINLNHAIAYLLVKESQVFIVRDAVKPKRAEIVE
ncbi:MAG: hypothetical protein OQJ96_13015 [Flavobacteriales bacterium]|jgi:hypothetical protein|nr:hypothetical protein [Flavobacteriales bacterium]MCW8913936.1 hypothetical protein [Flavobacteriales bacterium]MCW8936338.1 hypothetical protein [Flavobacteriales bacterium]MCW8968722.1 hypothetical protein [Flavobacteriales bacterium]MCW8991570.1 hypothetical protein [Flavobacteriales bacterium]